METFFRSVETADFFRGLAPALHIDAPPSDPDADGTHGRHLPPRRPWPRSGYVEVADALDGSTAAALSRATALLRARSLHPAFLYVYDEAWGVLDALREHLAPWLGPTFDVLADVWAWHVDPRTDRGGWPIHRGWYEDVRDAGGNPGLVNAWIALTDATERNACMHLVPLDRDRHYPDDLQQLGGLESSALAVPTAAGTVLAWSANVAHWGGSCDPTFAEPRVSMSFTLRTSPAVAVDAAVVRRRPTFRERLELIAEQFETYGERELDPQCDEMRWARALNGMRRAALLAKIRTAR